PPALCGGGPSGRPERTAPAGHERVPPFLDGSASLCCDHECLIMERSGIRNWLKVRMITGFFVTIPAVATAWILWIFWSRIDDIFGPMYERAFGRPVPGLGFMTAVTVIFLVGPLARNLFGRRVLAWGDLILERLPVFGRLYPSV